MKLADEKKKKKDAAAGKLNDTLKTDSLEEGGSPPRNPKVKFEK